MQRNYDYYIVMELWTTFETIAIMRHANPATVDSDALETLSSCTVVVLARHMITCPEPTWHPVSCATARHGHSRCLHGHWCQRVG